LNGRRRRRPSTSGDFYADSSLIHQALGWQPLTPLRDGLARTLQFYRANMQHYVPTTDSTVGAL
jgi:dTDP-glucose 4,6-dehydratase/UDP-glucose 4-epimerase